PLEALEHDLRGVDLDRQRDALVAPCHSQLSGTISDVAEAEDELLDKIRRVFPARRHPKRIFFWVVKIATPRSRILRKDGRDLTRFLDDQKEAITPGGERLALNADVVADRHHRVV